MDRCDICYDTEMSYCVTEEQLNAALSGKADKSTLYDYYLTKEVIYKELDNKLDNGDLNVLRDEIQGKLDNKADSSQLTYYVTSEKLSQVLESYTQSKDLVYYLTREQLDGVLGGYVKTADLVSFYFNKTDITNLLSNKLDRGDLNSAVNELNTKIDTKADRSQLDFYYTKDEVNVQLNNKLDSGDLNSLKDEIKNGLDTKVDKSQLVYYVTKEQLDLLLENYETRNDLQIYYYDKNQIDQLLSNTVNENILATYYYTKEEMNILLDSKVNVGDIITEEGLVIDSEMSETSQNAVQNKVVTNYINGVKTTLEGEISKKVNKDEFDSTITEINNRIDNIVTPEPDLTNYYTKGEVDTKLDTKVSTEVYNSTITEINNKIDTKANANDYVTKVEFNETVGDIESILNNVLNEL